MAKINCPECRKIISDKQDYCPECGFALIAFRNPEQLEDDDDKCYAFLPEQEPISQMTDEVVQHYIDMDQQRLSSVEISQKADDDKKENPDSVTVMLDENNKKKCAFRKKRRIYAAIAAVCLALCVCGGVFLSSAIKKDESLTENSNAEKVTEAEEVISTELKTLVQPNVKNVVVANVMYYEDSYIVNLQCDSDEEFIAVLTDQPSFASTVFHRYLVPMKEGMGSVNAVSLTDITLDEALERLHVEGYLSGYSLKRGDVRSSVTVKDSILSDEQVYTQEMDVTMTNDILASQNGLLFYEYQPDNTKDELLTGCCAICHGDGRIEQEYDNAAAEPELYPQFFVPCQESDTEDWYKETSFEQSHEVFEANEFRDKNYTTCEMTGGFQLNADDPFILLYSYSIVIEDSFQSFWKQNSDFAYCSGDNVVINIYEVIDGSNIDVQPYCSIYPAGYIQMKKLS